MKKRKIRGLNRRLKKIDNWVANCQNLNLEYLKRDQYEYVKFWVFPWGSLNFRNSVLPQPKGLARKKLLEGLFEIYQNWKQQLDELGEEYYLKIWLFSPNLSQSQVVCAIRERKNFYNNTFNKTEKPVQFPNHQFPRKLSSLQWESHMDELVLSKSDYDDSPEDYPSIEDYLDFQKYFKNKLKKPHKAIEEYGDTSYYFNQGYVWIGGN